jgi:hypothetical protein
MFEQPSDMEYYIKRVREGVSVTVGVEIQPRKAFTESGNGFFMYYCKTGPVFSFPCAHFNGGKQINELNLMFNGEYTEIKVIELISVHFKQKFQTL